MATSVLAALTLSGCLGTSPSSPPPSASVRVLTAPSATPSVGQPTPSSSGVSAPTTTPSCPSAQPLTVVAYLAADARCFLGAPVRVAGWVDRVQDTEVASFAAGWALRSDLANTGSVQSLFLTPAPSSTPMLPDKEQWAEVSVQRAPSSAPHCGWQLAASDPPTQVCFSLAAVSTLKISTPPASALAACPSTDQPMGVELFSTLPAACFGSATVTLTGWLGIAYVIGDWNVPWTIPSWLWRPGIGQFAALSPDSDALNQLAVPLYFRPNASLAQAKVDRWVRLSGHLADPAAASCRWVVPGTYDPATYGPKPDDASARAACTAAFVVDAISDGQP
jgi:hypothetical protein